MTWRRWLASPARTHGGPFGGPATSLNGRYAANRRRILILTSTIAKGGCERQILSTAAGLMQKGFQVAIVAFARAPADESLDTEFTEHSIPLSYLDEFPPNAASELPSKPAVSLPADMCKYAASVRSAILQYRPHVVHAWSDYAAIVGGSMAVALDVPRVVLGQRNVSPPSHLIENVATYREGYRILASSPQVILINNSAKNACEYERWLELPKGTIRVVHNGYFPGTVRNSPPEAVRQKRLDLGIPDGAKVVGSLMRFVAQKDPDLWLDTAQQIARDRDDVGFVLAGYGELREKIVDRISDLGLLPRFALLDEVTDLGLFYGLLDVFLMTSRFEGTPNVLIEAQAAGCPIVATDAGGIGETVADGVTGRIVADRSAASLAAAVLEALADDRWRTRAGEAGPSFVRQRFGHASMIAQTLRHYYPPTSILGRWLVRLEERWSASRSRRHSRNCRPRRTYGVSFLEHGATWLRERRRKGMVAP
jgi:glycosyltransferase involved in cell wall biosynthesis